MFPDIGGFFENIFDAFSGPSQRISGPQHRGSPIVQGYGNQIRGASRGVAHAGASVSRGALDLVNPIPQSKLEVGLMLATGPVGVVGRSSARAVRGLSAARKAVREAEYHRLQSIVPSPAEDVQSIAAQVGIPTVQKGHVRLYRGIGLPDPTFRARRRDFFTHDPLTGSSYAKKGPYDEQTMRNTWADEGYIHAFDVPKKDILKAKGQTENLPHNTAKHKELGLANPSAQEQRMIKSVGYLPDWAFAPDFNEYVPMTHAAVSRMKKVGSVSYKEFDAALKKQTDAMYPVLNRQAKAGLLGPLTERKNAKLAARKIENYQRSVPMVQTARLSAREKQIADKMLRAHQWLKGRQ